MREESGEAGDGRGGPPVVPWGGPLGWRAPRRESAVLVPLIRRAGVEVVVLTRRADGLRRQAGQVAFPGGMRDPGDATPTDTALREAAEEVGIDPGGVEILGELPEHVTLSAIHVRAVVARLRPDAALRANPAEVGAIYEVPVDDVRGASIATHWRVGDDGRLKQVHFWDWRGVVVWGVTARLLLCLREWLAARAGKG